VYWMALAAIPASILTKLRKMMFNFLWSGCSDHTRQHLCSWHTLAKPKRKGGWGIQNPLLFSQALAATSLWRALTRPGIWHSVILDKYLNQYTVKNWLSAKTNSPNVASHFWRYLSKSKHLITSHLCWHLGSGHTIILGQDNIMGMDRSSSLSVQLLSTLHSKNIWFLFQIRATSRSDALPDSWINNNTLGLNQIQRANGRNYVWPSLSWAFTSRTHQIRHIGRGAINQAKLLQKTFMLQLPIRIGPITSMDGRIDSRPGVSLKRLSFSSSC
jgi:hypothetical protein